MNDSRTELASTGSRDPFGVLILCAGASRRMGFPKALLDWGGKSMLEHARDLWRQAGAATVAVVFDPRIGPVVAELERLGIRDRIPNPAADDGMMASLRAASRWEGWDASLGRIAVALVDQPGISPGTLKDLAEASEQAPQWIWQPSVDGRRGHPLFLPRGEFDRLADCKEDSLRDFIRGREELRKSRACEDRAILQDLDTPQRYRMAKAAAGFTE